MTETNLSREAALASNILGYYVLPAVASAGIVGNTLIFLAWTVDRSGLQISKFLIQCLAIADVFVSFFHTFIKLAEKNEVKLSQTTWKALFGVRFFFQFNSINTTLALVVFRWLAVTWPLHVQRIVNKTRTQIGYACLILWCATLATLDILCEIIGMPGLKLITVAVGGVSPVFALIVFNTLLLRALRRRSQKAICSSLDDRTLHARSDHLRRLVKAVVCVCATTAFAYVIVYIPWAYSELTNNVDVIKACGGDGCVKLSWALIDFIEVIGASANVVYYALFLAAFRNLLRQRFKCCCCRCGCKEQSLSISSLS